jgi:hypothetical protein
MEITPAGFVSNQVDTITAVTATTITVNASRVAESAQSGRSLSVLLPAARAWENIKLVPETGEPYVGEDYVPGPTEQITVGSLGEMECLPLYVARVYVRTNIGRAAVTKYADAILNHFAPRYALTLTDGTLTVRTNPGPFAGQLIPTEAGWAVVPVTIPLRYRVANSI